MTTRERAERIYRKLDEKPCVDARHLKVYKTSLIEFQLAEHTEALRAENAKLREALQQVVKHNECECDHCERILTDRFYFTEDGFIREKTYSEKTK